MIIKLIGELSMYWWCWWSNYRFRKCIRSNIGTESMDKVGTLDDLKELVKRLYHSFIWTADGIDQLGDAITPPPQNYAIYLEKPLKDDCDGFHALVYHCLYNSGIECYLLTANPKKPSEGHCILIFYLDGKWYINDYNRVYEGFDTAIEAIRNYNEIYVEKYKCSGPVVYNGLIEYNYEEGKFKKKNLSDLKK